MTEHGYDEIDETLPEAQPGELVHWMEPRPLALGPTGASIAVGAAFALGLLTAAAVVGAMRLARSERRITPPVAKRLRRWS